MECHQQKEHCPKVHLSDEVMELLSVGAAGTNWVLVFLTRFSSSKIFLLLKMILKKVIQPEFDSVLQIFQRFVLRCPYKADLNNKSGFQPSFHDPESSKNYIPQILSDFRVWSLIMYPICSWSGGPLCAMCTHQLLPSPVVEDNPPQGLSVARPTFTAQTGLSTKKQAAPVKGWQGCY